MVREGAVRSAWAFRESEAYRSGWEDGRFGPLENWIPSSRVEEWMGSERLAYYRGHREGRRVRDMLGVDGTLARSR